ncbi:MAG: addiction module protein [Chloroflexi bacterium]|nr:addiction module protein [Chloroflexota bacterium]
MTPQSQHILKEVLGLSPVDRAELIEHIMASFDFPARKEVDAAWAQEAEDRIDAYDQGKMAATPVDDVFRDIERQA